MYNCIFCLENNCIQLKSTEESAIKWAKEVLTPYIKIGKAENVILSIECIYGKKEKPVGEFVGKESMFLNKTGKRYKNPGGFDIVNEEETLYRVLDDKLTIYFPCLTEDTMREPSRLCREILYNSLNVSEWQEIHASAVSYRNQGIAFVGNKGAGKSTFLSLMLSKSIDHTDTRFNYVTNDRLWINSKNNRILGSPMPVLLGYGTMMRIPELNGQLSMFRDGYYILNHLLKEKKHEYTVNEFAKFFDTKIETEARLKAIIVLDSTKEMTMPRLVENDEIEKKYIDLARNTSHSTYPNWLQIGKSPDEREKTYLKNISIYTMGFDFSEQSIIKSKRVLLEMFSDILF